MILTCIINIGVAAAELAKAGKSVLVIDKGKYYHEDDFDLRESAGFANLYEYGGFFSTYEGSVNVLAGSVFGGGTTVNWSASLKVYIHFYYGKCTVGLTSVIVATLCT